MERLIEEKGEVLLQRMDSIFCWNVRGLNQRSKQVLVRNLIRKCKAGLVGLLETRIKLNKLGEFYKNVFDGWCFTCNNAWHKGGPNNGGLESSLISSGHSGVYQPIDPFEGAGSCCSILCHLCLCF